MAKQKKTSPLITYYGGKQRIASKIVPYLQEIPHTVYVTPFAGGLGVFYSRPVPRVTNNNYYREVINDIDGLLVNLYRVAREQPEEFERLVFYTPYSRAEYTRANEICENPDHFSDLEKAWAYYCNIQMSFANKLNAGWGVAVKSGNHAATWNNKKWRLPEKLARLADVAIECRDALEVIRQWDAPQTLFYCDPPYVDTAQGHYKGYTEADYGTLCDLLDNIEGSYVLSGYSSTIEPQSYQKKVEIETHCAASGKGKVRRQGKKQHAIDKHELGDRRRSEVLWICDRSHNICSSLTPALEQLELSFPVKDTKCSQGTALIFGR